MSQEKAQVRPADALDQQYEAVALELALKKAEEEAFRPNQLLSKEALTCRFKQELQDAFTSYRQQQCEGVVALVRAIGELRIEITEELAAGLQRLASLSDKIAKDDRPELSLQEIANVDDAVMDILYQGAKRLFDQENFADAAAAFRFLTSLNPKKYLFWQALAHAEFRQKHYQEALKVFSLLLVADPRDPISYIATSSCHEELGNIPQAIDALNEALVAIEGVSEYAHLKGVMEQTKARLVQKQH